MHSFNYSSTWFGLLFSFPLILSGSFYFSVWSSAGTFTLLLPIHHCFCYFCTSPFCWVYGFHRLSTLISIKRHDKHIKKSQVNMRLPCKNSSTFEGSSSYILFVRIEATPKAFGICEMYFSNTLGLNCPKISRVASRHARCVLPF